MVKYTIVKDSDIQFVLIDVDSVVFWDNSKFEDLKTRVETKFPPPIAYKNADASPMEPDYKWPADRSDIGKYLFLNHLRNYRWNDINI